MKKDTAKTCFTLGLVGAAYGLKGFVKVKPFSGESAHFTLLEKVTLKKAEREEIREVAEVILGGNSLLMRFTGIESPEAAASLAGAEIIALREYAAPLQEGEFCVEDLKGLEVVTVGGESLGFINDVIEGGGGNLTEVLFPSGKEQFAPFRKEFFGAPDFNRGTITLLEPWIFL